MNDLHLDLSCGVAGDMLLAALAGVCGDPDEAIRSVSNKLQQLGAGSIGLELVRRKVASIATLGAEVTWPGGQPLRHLSDLLGMVEQGVLDDEVALAASRVFRDLARAEAKVHGTSEDQVHFHEVGAIDTVADVVGALLLVRRIGPGRITATPVNLGGGFVTMAHGTHPVPPPAVAELARGLRTFGSGPETGELATPTGMALVRELVDGFGPLPRGEVLRVGYGSGTRSSDDNPTYVRAFVFEPAGHEHDHGHHRHGDHHVHGGAQ